MTPSAARAIAPACSGFRVGAETIEALDGAVVVARHARARKGDEVLALDHYLEVLAVKTGAFPGATALARARAGGVFGPTHERFWAEARRRLGDRDGTRALIDVLLLNRSVPADVSKKRDVKAATRFFSAAIKTHGEPAEVTTDRSAALARTIVELLPGVHHDTTQFANKPG